MLVANVPDLEECDNGALSVVSPWRDGHFDARHDRFGLFPLAPQLLMAPGRPKG
jgi:hypothetical protein